MSGRVCPSCGCSERNACLVTDGLSTDNIKGCSWVQGTDLCSACTFPATKVHGLVDQRRAT